MLYRFLKRFGVLKVTIAISLATILVSNLITTIFNTLSVLGRITFSPFLIPTVVPAIVTPILIYQLLRLVVQINLAEEKLRALSITDELTGAYNRRHFIDIAKHEQAKAQRYGETLSIAILDIDDFKHINDTCGHLTGDQALITVARICRENMRAPDIFARYGGDEFVFLFPATGKEKARQCLERILADISNHPIQQDGCTIKIQVSIGLAEHLNKEFLIEDVLRAADTALYQAKRAGKNKIISTTAG